MKRLYLLGYPLAHSLSPAMQNAALEACGLGDWRYELMQVAHDDLPQAVARLRADDCSGANVTIPHKEAVIRWLDDLDKSACKIGAVNTIIKREGKLIGHNTDVEGFSRALSDACVHTAGTRTAILGAGGAARAAAFALAEAGAQSIAILNRTASRAIMLIDSLGEHYPELEMSMNSKALNTTDIIVNATSVGMFPHTDESPLPPDHRFRPGSVAFDLVYRPAETQFLREAHKAGAHPLGGLGMLVHQGAASFKLWTALEPPVEAMFKAARQALG